MVEKCMPETYGYEIISADDVVEDVSCCKFVARVGVRDENEALEWLRGFQSRTKTQWTVKAKTTTSQTHAHFVYNCNFVCHHSDFRKVMTCVWYCLSSSLVLCTNVV